MLFKEFNSVVSDKDVSVNIMLPNGEFVPPHFHVTEIGIVNKKFVDCGGTKRELNTCLLQVWVADDVDHRLTASKLAKIIKAVKVEDNLPIEIEYGDQAVSQYALKEIENTPCGLLFVLCNKQTECLAPDKCGVSCCRGSKC